MNNVRDATKDILSEPLYRWSPSERERRLLPLFQDRIANAAKRHVGYGHYVANWPVPIERATRLSDLPYLPVSIFKSSKLISLLTPGEGHRVVASSGTSTQIPSRVVVDKATAKSMSLGAITIFGNFIGSHRRPYLIIDSPPSKGGEEGLSSRGAAIRGLMPMATQWHWCLRDDMQPDVEQLHSLADQYRDCPVLLYGFTYVLWFHFVAELRTRGIKLNLPQAVVLHSGGWKKMTAESVTKSAFNHGVAEVVGCSPDRVIDYYGMVENIGVVYPDCEYGNKHVPSFADVAIRSPLTLQPVDEGETGIIQVGSLLPESFPGHLLLTEDLGTLVCRDGCRCGRRGVAFRVDGRIPRAELRGCGDIIAKKLAA